MQLFTLSFSAHAQNVRTKNFLLIKPSESFDTEIMKKLIKFQYWARENFLIKKTCITFVYEGIQSSPLGTINL